MEVAVIDWKNIDSRFVRDDMLENINAPQWVDFSAPDADIDDESWFCRPDCKHPKTVEDFYKAMTPNSKRSSNLLERLPFGERSRSLRDPSLKKRGLCRVSISPSKDLKYGRIAEDGENQNPNILTPPNYKSKSMKEAIKSSAEKKTMDDSNLKKEQPRSLKSTLSARNLFTGGDILNKVTEFCNELKKLAMRSKDRENVEGHVVENELNNVSKNLGDEQKERKPLLEASPENGRPQQKRMLQEKIRRKKRSDDAENTPITVDVKNIKCKEESSLPIRTCPPTPQCFSVSNGPSKAFKSRTLERRILNELLQEDITVEMKNVQRKINPAENGCIVADKEAAAKALDVLWFLKPCTLSS